MSRLEDILSALRLRTSNVSGGLREEANMDSRRRMLLSSSTSSMLQVGQRNVPITTEQ